MIKPQFLVWLKKQHPDARIVLDYENLAKSTIDPDSVDDSIEKWTYDKNDAQRYSMNLKETGIGYYDCWRVEKCIPPKYDVVYVGRDKGRAEKLLDFELQLQKMGLKTYFHICPDRRFLKYKKRFYKSLLNYPQYLKLIGNTKVILNIAQANCESVTLREMEAVFHEIKCITDNKSIKNWRLYHPSRFFILGEDDLSSLPAFISSDFITASKEDFSLHVFDRLVESIYYSKKDLEN